MTRLHGRSPRGQRLVGAAPLGHCNTSMLIAALRHDGVLAPMVFGGAINGRAFLAWVRQVLAPVLRPGDIVVVDNLACHKVAGVRDAIEACGASLLFLPACSPDLNPIEQVFARIKTLIRKAEPRSRNTLWRTVGAALDRSTPAECSNYLRHCGYAYPWRNGSNDRAGPRDLGRRPLYRRYLRRLIPAKNDDRSGACAICVDNGA